MAEETKEGVVVDKAFDQAEFEKKQKEVQEQAKAKAQKELADRKAIEEQTAADNAKLQKESQEHLLKHAEHLAKVEVENEAKASEVKK